MTKIFEYLNKVVFYEDEKQASQLHDYGYSHRFFGVGLEKPLCHHVKQVHGASLIEVQAEQSDEAALDLEADGLYSLAGKGPLGVKTADCLPLIIASKNLGFLAVLHAGWRGLAAGIVQKGILLAKNFSPLNDLMVLAGPCISAHHFQVGPELIDTFASQALGLSEQQLLLSLFKGIDDRWHLDISMLALSFCANMGILPENIAVLRSCTYSEVDKWYSYRRSGKRQKSIWSVAWRI